MAPGERRAEMAKIVRDGFFFRAVWDGFRSTGFTSPSQAGLLIRRKFGAEAERAAIAGLKV